MKAGMIGLGAMGLGMAKNLATTGMLKAIYNRTGEKANNLADELGVISCVNVQLLAAQVDVVFICISDDDAVLQVVNALAKTIRPDSIVVDMSTVSSDTAKKAATILAKKQVSFLDAPVSGGVEGAKNGTLAMMVGGDEAVLNKISYLLDAMCSRIVYMGETGAGQGTKAVNQIMAAGIAQAVTEALDFGQKQGLALDKVIEVISAGAAGSWFLQHRGQTMVNGCFDPGFKVKLHHKDLAICQKMAEQSGVTSRISDTTLKDYQSLMNQGFGNEDISALYRLKKQGL